MSTTVSLRNLCAAVMLSAVIACGSQEIASGVNVASTGVTVTQLLAAASGATGLLQARYLLDAVNLLIKEDKPDRAEAILRKVDKSELDPAARARFAEMQARLELERGQPAAALALLNDQSLLKSSAQLPPDAQISLSLLRAKTLAATGDYL